MKHCQRHGPEKDPYCADCWKDERERTALGPSDATAGSPSSTPEVDAITTDPTTSIAYKASALGMLARKLTRERDEAARMWSINQDQVAALKAWIMQAAPMLSAAACIVIDESIERLGEIEGVRGVLELCPVDFSIPHNDQVEARRK